VISVIIFLGYLRDFIFVHLNDQLAVRYYLEYRNTRYEYPLPPSLSFFSTMSYTSLSTWKWILSGVFMILHFAIAVTVIKRLFPLQRYGIYIIAGAFMILLIIAGLSYAYGSLSGNWDKAYPLAITFSHMAQSPIVLMILVPAFMLVKQENQPPDIT
jgi:hypothetical protein